MSARKRGRGDGTIDLSGDGTWRVRYRLGGKRFQKTVTGTKAGARKELRRLLHSGDTRRARHAGQNDLRTVGRALAQYWSAGQ
jgi:hypothetical protein